MANWLDVLILIALALSAFSGLRSGFLRQVLALVGFVVGVYAALGNYASLAGRLGEWIENPGVASIVAFLLLLFAVWITFAFLGAAARQILKTMGLAWTDHLLGMLLGLATGLLVMVVLLLLLTRIPLPAASEIVSRSMLAPWVFRMLPYLRQLLPSDWHWPPLA